jgi:hypothetical protein
MLAKASSEHAVFASVVMAAFASRFYALGKDSLWLDEAITFHRSNLGLSKLIADAEVHHHNPGYFLLMHAWLKLGDDEVMMRAPSALAGALTVIVGYFLGRVAGGRWVATATAVALLLNPGLVSYAQEARMYGIYVLGASVATLGLFWLLEHPSEALHPVLGLLWRRERRVGAPATLAWLACSFGWIVALYSHATGALFVLSCSVVALARIALCPVDRGRFLASFGIANLVALVAFAPWLVRLVGQMGKFKQSFWATFPTLERIQRDAGDAFFFGSQPWRWVVVGVVALVGTYALRRKPLVAASLWLLSLLGPGLLLLASLWKPMFFCRQFLWAAVPFGVLVGAGLVAPSRVPARIALVVAAIVAGSWALGAEYYQPLHKARWRDAVTFLQARERGGDKVVLANHSVKRMLDYYFSRKTASFKRVKYERVPRTSPALAALRGKAPIWVVSRGGGRSLEQLVQNLSDVGWEQVRVDRYGGGVALRNFRRAHGRKRGADSLPQGQDAAKKSKRRPRPPASQGKR